MPQSSKFEGVDFSQMMPEKLTSKMDVPGQGFRSVRGEFVTYWRQGRVLREVNANISQCWTLQVEESLAGYITLLADKLTLEDPILLNEGVKYRTFPAVKIGLLAVDRRTKGVGHQLAEWAIEYVAAEISPMLGVRFMTVDALYDPDVDPHYDASGFYRRIGFRFASPNEELPPIEPYRTLYLDLKPVIDLLDTQDVDPI